MEKTEVLDWNSLLQDHGPDVFRAAWRILGNAADAEDVVQDVYLEAVRLSTTRSVRSWPGLLRRLAVCRALDRIRRRKASIPLNENIVVSARDSPVAIALGQELAERLRDALAQLPERESEVFCLHYFEDLSCEQIGETLGIRANAAAVALHRARARLELLLSEVTRGDQL